MRRSQSSQHASRCIGQHRRPEYSLALALALLSLGACSVPSEPVGSSDPFGSSGPVKHEFSFDVQGTVQSGADGGPIDRAWIVLYRSISTGFKSGARREAFQTEYSAADGTYRIQASFRDTHCGFVYVGARSPGHVDRDVSLISVGGTGACHGTPVRVDLMLTPDEGSE